MTKQEVIDTVKALSAESQIVWLIDLGAQLTISARIGYPVGEEAGSITHLIAFNEMQHQVYGRIRHLRRGEQWTLESFLDALMQRAKHYGVEGDFGAALVASLRT